jgi:hypothetical protein
LSSEFNKLLVFYVTFFSFRMTIRIYMGPLLKMPAGVFIISVVLIMLFIFIESRFTGNKKGYGYYIKYGFFVGLMNTMLFYISNGTSLSSQFGAGTPGIGNGGVTNVMSSVRLPPAVMTCLPEIF